MAAYKNYFHKAIVKVVKSLVLAGSSRDGTGPEISASSGNLALSTLQTGKTDNAGKTVRLNSITNNGTANSLIGFQSKPGQGTSTAQNVIGCEISPRLSDNVALTGSGSIIGAHVDTYLKGDAGNIAGDVRGVQVELVDDNSAGRTVAGNVSHLRLRSNLSCAVTGKVSAVRVENEEGAKAMDGLFQFTTGLGALVEGSGTVGGTQDRAIKVLIGTTTYYIPLHTSVS
jgi:hypothetical protein